jgi:hypothetical protein
MNIPIYGHGKPGPVDPARKSRAWAIPSMPVGRLWGCLLGTMSGPSLCLINVQNWEEAWPMAQSPTSFSSNGPGFGLELRLDGRGGPSPGFSAPGFVRPGPKPGPARPEGWPGISRPH